MHIGNYLNLLHHSEQELAKAFRMVAQKHGDEPDVRVTCELLASWSEEAMASLQPFTEKYEEQKNPEPERLFKTLFDKPRTGSMALLRDLHDLWLMAGETELSSIILRQASDGLRDKALTDTCNRIEKIAKRQLAWLLSRMKSAAPQTLLVAS